jgi:hypothetical protein
MGRGGLDLGQGGLLSLTFSITPRESLIRESLLRGRCKSVAKSYVERCRPRVEGRIAPVASSCGGPTAARL